TSDARQRHLVAAGHGLREQPCGDRGIIGVRLVEGPDDRLEDVPDVRLDVNQREIGAMPDCEGTREVSLVGRACPGSRVARRERMWRVARQRHTRHYCGGVEAATQKGGDRKSTRLNSSHVSISYAVFCLKKK